MKIVTLIIAGLLMLTQSACTKAHGDDTSIQSMQAADGTWCYVLIQEGQAKGISCK